MTEALARFGRLRLTDGRAVFAELEADAAWILGAAPWAGGERTGERVELASARLLAPVVPSKIVCVGRNYRAHAAELGNVVPAEPLLFFKPPSAVLDPGGTIELPAVSERVEHEAELGLVIGARLKDASEDDARRAIFGATIVGDITARDLQKKDGQWTRAKGFDTFCPVGPWIVRGLELASLSVRCWVGEELRQSGSCRDMVFSPEVLCAYVSRVMTLEPGDLIATGTPEGVGPIRAGDTLRLAIEGIGEMSLGVRAR
jgi:2-keto-4-pentenoate hydratase/2-oxohepta-3-ene-1,7-dioic acid hydratase in catechol pathway